MLSQTISNLLHNCFVHPKPGQCWSLRILLTSCVLLFFVNAEKEHCKLVIWEWHHPNYLAIDTDKTTFMMLQRSNSYACKANRTPTGNMTLPIKSICSHFKTIEKERMQWWLPRRPLHQILTVTGMIQNCDCTTQVVSNHLFLKSWPWNC